MLEYKFGPHLFCVGRDILEQVKMNETDTRYLLVRAISIGQLMLRGYEEELKPHISIFAVLNAHGGTNDGKWAIYESHQFGGTIQNWIDERDGKYGALFLLCCNKDGHEIKSKKSAVVHAQGIAEEGHLTGELVVEMNTTLRVYIPGRGYLPIRQTPQAQEKVMLAYPTALE